MENKKVSRRSAQEMYPLIERYLSSEQTQREFCIQGGLNQGVFSYWLGRYRSQQQETPGGFAEIAVPDRIDGEWGIELEYPNGIKVRMAAGASASYVRSLLEIKL